VNPIRTKKQRRGEPRPGRLLSAFHYEVLDELELEAAMGDPLHGREVSGDGFTGRNMYHWQLLELRDHDMRSSFVVESSGLPSGVATPGRGDELTGRLPDA
jgi:hypothetical protein